MSGNIDQFRADLRANLLATAASFDRFNAILFQTATSTEQDLRERLAILDETAELTRFRAIAANADFNRWMEEARSETFEKVAGWKSKRQTGRLHARADRLERCASTAVEIALLAMQEAERTAVGAILARKEAISIQVQRNDGA
jgi:hypothetical protein